MTPPAAPPKGQALVEFALVLPLLLLIVLGGIGLSLAMTLSSDLGHGAREAAVAGAQSGGDCSVAEARVPQLLGFAPNSVECSETGQLITVRITHSDPLLATIHDLFGFVPSSLSATGRAVKRDEEPIPSPS